MERLRLLSAFQALSMPEGAYGPAVTHALALSVIAEITQASLIDRTVRPPRTARSLEDFMGWYNAQALCGVYY
jgi:hypothetical protein